MVNSNLTTTTGYNISGFDKNRKGYKKAVFRITLNKVFHVLIFTKYQRLGCKTCKKTISCYVIQKYNNYELSLVS